MQSFVLRIKRIMIYGISVLLYTVRGTRWRSWLTHCATSQKVVGWIPDGFIGIFL